MMPTIIIGALQTKGDNTVPGISVEQISWIGELLRSVIDSLLTFIEAGTSN